MMDFLKNAIDIKKGFMIPESYDSVFQRCKILRSFLVILGLSYMLAPIYFHY